MNFKNRTIFTGDNLPVLRGTNSEAADLIYLDPPFNSKKQWNAPIGSQAAGAGFKDAWTLSDIDLETHDQLEGLNPALHQVILAARGAGGDSTMSYLLMMAPRLLELRRVLKDTGTIYLHCDPTESHSLKLMMDTIFGREQFLNEVVWWYHNVAAVSRRMWGRKHDTLLVYTGGGEWTFNPDPVRVPYSPTSNYAQRGGGSFKHGGVPHPDGKLPHDVFRLPTINNMAKERVGYPTQKPLALLERIILASSNEDDVVLDPFCGCATACIAAEKLGRRWAGIDFSEKAIELVERRLHEQLGLSSSLAIHRTDIPKRTDLGDLPHYKTHKTALYVEQEGRCGLCGVWFEQGNLSVDHIVSRKKGGNDHKDNLQLLCRACNSKKGTRTWESVKADYYKERRRR